MPTNEEAFEMCRGFAEFINNIYPGYVWQVGMMGDLVYVQNLSLNRKQGFRVPLKDIDIDGKVLMRAGGELLERYRLRRGKKEPDRVKALKRDITGNAIQP
jgi:hypothetical protein